MFLGRSTLQWTGLISGVVGVLQIAIPQIFPRSDPVQVASVLGAVATVLGLLIAFIANTSTTPIADPQLKAGTLVRVTDETGTVVGHLPVPTPEPPPVEIVDAGADGGGGIG